MNYTQNLKLPQWNESDRIRMKDFNDAMANIEKSVSDVSSKVTDVTQPYVIGSYVPDGDLQFVFLDFEPSFVIISGMQQTTDTEGTNLANYFVATGHNPAMEGRVMLTTYGFCTMPAPHDGLNLPNLCEKDRQYFYIAFR